MILTARPRRLFWLLLVAGAARPSAADVILLRNGNEIQGEIIEETPQKLTVRFIGGTLYIPAREVVSVRRQSRISYLLEQGESSLKRDEPEDAVAIFRKARAEDASSEPALKGLLNAEERFAEGLAAAGRYGEALAAYQALLVDAPDHPRATESMRRIRQSLEEAAREEQAGRAALLAGRVDEALSRLRAVFDRFPERRATSRGLLAQALVRSGDALLSGGDFAAAESRYLEGLSIDPDLVPAMTTQFAYARARRLAPLVERGEFQAVLAGAEDGLRIVPQDRILSYFAALGMEGVGRKREARESYQKIAGLDRGRTIQKSIESLRQAAEEKIAALASGATTVDARRSEVLAGDWRETTTEHFLVRHRNEAIAAEVAQAAEAAYALLYRELALKANWTRRCTITLFPTQEEFQSATGQYQWTGGAHRIQRRFGALADHQIFSFQLQPRLAGAVIPHEVAHAMLAYRVGYGHDIPLWLNEGFAMHWEPAYVHHYQDRIARQAAETRTLLPLSSLLGMDGYPSGEDAVRLFYAESHTLVELLLEERSLAVLIEFASDLTAAPDTIERLLERHYRLRGLKALESRWVARLLN